MSLLFWTHLLAASEWIIRVIMLPVIVLRKHRPVTALAWLSIVFLEPWIGLGAYLLSGREPAWPKAAGATADAACRV